MSCRASVVWDEGVLGYDFGNHPLNPIRLEFTIALARELGVLDDVEVVAPRLATREELLVAHDADYLDAVHDGQRGSDVQRLRTWHRRRPGLHRYVRRVGAGRRWRLGRRRRSVLECRRARVEHRRRSASRDARLCLGILRLQRRGARDPTAVGGRRAAGRLRRHRRAPRRRRPGRVLRRPAGA